MPEAYERKQMAKKYDITVVISLDDRMTPGGGPIMKSVNTFANSFNLENVGGGTLFESNEYEMEFEATNANDATGFIEECKKLNIVRINGNVT